jgi:hypothetical protein
MPRCLLVAAAMAVLSACASSPAAPDASPTDAGPLASSDAVLGLPPGCETIDLRSPTGERVDLTGVWVGDGELANRVEQAWLNQIGDCVFGSVLGGAFVEDTEPEASLTNLNGRVGSNFRIEFEVIMVFQDARFAFGEFSAMPMLIEWDAEGRMRLREDREPGDVAGRCIHSPTFPCPDPVIWYRVDDTPGS